MSLPGAPGALAAADGAADALAAAFGAAQQWLFETAVQPLLFHAGFAQLLEDAYRGTGWLLVGLLQLAVMAAIALTLERWRPVEPVTDRRAVATDVVYTLIHRLGLLRLLLFFTLDPLWGELASALRRAGLPAHELEQAVPFLAAHAWAAFLAYLLLFDLVDYALHRAQHRVGWWWALHAVHHSQRQMTVWSDSRNHLLDDLLRDSAFVLVALAVGVPPGQFVALVAVTQLLESLSHANVRLGFGPVLRRLLVDPHFHRVHHAIGLDPPAHGRRGPGGCNYAVLFPLWDQLFGSARFDAALEPTGIRDQLPPGQGGRGRDYGRGWWAQQALALRSMAVALRGR